MAAGDPVETDAQCWCCGQSYPDARLVHLGSHPEVAVCFRCARFLNRRARQAQDQLQPSPGARVRGVLNKGRDVVVEHRWHQLPTVGASLRWLGDHLP